MFTCMRIQTAIRALGYQASSSTGPDTGADVKCSNVEIHPAAHSTLIPLVRLQCDIIQCYDSYGEKEFLSVDRMAEGSL